MVKKLGTTYIRKNFTRLLNPLFAKQTIIIVKRYKKEVAVIMPYNLFKRGHHEKNSKKDGRSNSISRRTHGVVPRNGKSANLDEVRKDFEASGGRAVR